MCKPADNFVNDTESSVCGIPPTPTNNSTTTTTPPSSSAAAAANNTAGAEVPSKSLMSSPVSARTTITAAVSDPTRNPLLSSQSTVAPQAKLTQGSEQKIATTANGTDGQNYTFTSTSPIVGSGKLMYLGFHGISSSTTNNGSTGRGGSSVTKSDAPHNTSSSLKHKDTTTSPSSSTSRGGGSTKGDSNSNGNNNNSHTTKSKPKKSHGSSDSVQGIIGSALG